MFSSRHRQSISCVLTWVASLPTDRYHSLDQHHLPALCVFRVILRVHYASSEVLARDIFSPPIVYPHAATVWFAGQRHNVCVSVILHSTVIHILSTGYLVGLAFHVEQTSFNSITQGTHPMLPRTSIMLRTAGISNWTRKHLTIRI